MRISKSSEEDDDDDEEGHGGSGMGSRCASPHAVTKLSRASWSCAESVLSALGGSVISVQPGTDGELDAWSSFVVVAEVVSGDSEH